MPKKIKISKFIDKELKEFALYTMTSRGIPNVHDFLTIGERLALKYAPENFEKTLRLVGDVIGSGQYHHGDSSISGTIMKMAKPFQNSDTLLIGEGFFGSEIIHRCAAPRYTSIKINPVISPIIEKYKDFHKENIEKELQYFRVDTPIGLSLLNLGMSVGYICKILPRSLKDVQKYLNAKKRFTITPSFPNWNGTIEPVEKNTWKLIGKTEFDPVKLNIEFQSIPPLINISNFLKKVENFIKRNDIKVKISNKSNDKICICIHFMKKDEYENYTNDFKLLNEMIFKESVVLTDSDNVVIYDTIEDYLDQFKLYNIQTNFKYTNKIIDDNNEKIELVNNKIKFVTSVVEAIKTKKDRLTEEEMQKIYNNFEKKYFKIFDQISVRNLTENYIDSLKNMRTIFENKMTEAKEELEKINLELEKNNITKNSLIFKSTTKEIKMDKDEKNFVEFLNEIEKENQINDEDEE